MFKEFAVEPSLMAEWESFSDLRDKFGVFQGRFIADLPRKKWKKMVAALLDQKARGDHPIRKSAVMAAWLQSPDGRRDARFSRPGGAYDETKTWLENAETEDHRFDAVLATAESKSTKAIMWDEVEPFSRHPLFAIETQPRIARRGSDLLEVIKPLLRLSKKVRWVDSYLNPDPRSLEAVLDCLHWIVRENIGIEHLELHLSARHVDPLAQQTNYRRVFGALIPDRLQLTIHWWSPGAENTHPRFVLTDMGGMHFDHGTDPGHGSTIVHLLSQARWHEEFQRYRKETTDLVHVAEAAL